MANFNDAPPIRPPSTSGKLNISTALLALHYHTKFIEFEIEHQNFDV